MTKFDAINEKLPLFLFMFHARSLFVTAFEGKERDAIDVAVSPSECSFVHLVESQCAEKQSLGLMFCLWMRCLNPGYSI